MYTIQTSIEIPASMACLHSAITTLEGFRAWLAEDTQRDAAGHYTFWFGARAVTFAVDRTDERGIAMTCVREQDNPDWLGTELSIELTALSAGKTCVKLAHAGYASKNECYARCVDGWEHFLTSLARYTTTGKGMPFAKLAALAPAPSSVEMAS